MNDIELAKKFAYNLSNVLHENRITQRELATKLGISEQAVSNWSRGLKLSTRIYKAFNYMWK